MAMSDSVHDKRVKLLEELNAAEAAVAAADLRYKKAQSELGVARAEAKTARDVLTNVLHRLTKMVPNTVPPMPVASNAESTDV